MKQLMQQPSFWMIEQVAVNPDDRFRMFSFRPELQSRLETLLDTHRSTGLTEDETAEMHGLLELNKILSFVNTKLATELWQSATSPDNWSENELVGGVNTAIH
jgi:hypothetical protein